MQHILPRSIQIRYYCLQCLTRGECMLPFVGGELRDEECGISDIRNLASGIQFFTEKV